MSKLTNKDIATLRSIVSKMESMEDINLLYKIANDQQRLFQARTKAAFKLGDRVSFRGRRGEVVTGFISKKNPKTIIVIADSGVQWKVTPSLLKKAEEKKAA